MSAKESPGAGAHVAFTFAPTISHGPSPEGRYHIILLNIITQLFNRD